MLLSFQNLINIYYKIHFFLVKKQFKKTVLRQAILYKRYRLKMFLQNKTSAIIINKKYYSDIDDILEFEDAEFKIKFKVSFKVSQR